MIKYIYFKKINNLEYEFSGVFNNGSNFKHRGHFFILSDFEEGECPIFCDKFCVHNGRIHGEKIVLKKNFKIFVDCIHVCHKEKFIICIQNGVIGSKRIINRLVWLIDRIVEFVQKYFGIIYTKSLIFRLFYDLPNNFESPVFFIDLNTFPFPERDPHNFKEKLRFLIKRILIVIMNRDHHFVSLVCMYFERFTFNNPNEVMYLIYKDYKANRNNQMYHYVRVLNKMFKSGEPLLSLFYLKALKNLFLVKDCLNDSLKVMYEYPILKIDVEEINYEHVFYVLITISQQNGSWFHGHIECLVHERTGVNKIYLLVNGNPTVFCYNCRGRLNKVRKDLKRRKTNAPEKIFDYIEFNYNGKLPCVLITDHIKQKMVIDCGFWTKLVCLENLKDLKEKPNFTVIKTLVDDILFKKFSKTEGYFKLLKPLCRFLFNSSNFMTVIYKVNYYNPKNINFAIGLYKKIYLNKNVYKPVIVRDLYNPVQYNLRKALLKQISLCVEVDEQYKIFIFFKEIIEDFEFNDKKFFQCLVKCFDKNNNWPKLKTFLKKKHDESIFKKQIL